MKYLRGAYFIVTKFSDNKLEYNPDRLYCFITSRLTEISMFGNCYIGEKILYLQQFSLIFIRTKALGKKNQFIEAYSFS